MKSVQSQLFKLRQLFGKSEIRRHDIVLAAIGLTCMGYLWFGRPFAELHLNLPGLPFPIFVGEILLILCGFLVFSDMLKSSELDMKWRIGFACFLLFVLLKAIFGYANFGPLAFRHAALFYYVSFAIIGYHCSCHSNLFSNSSKTLILALYLLALHFSFFFRGYVMPLLYTGIFLSVSLKNTRLRYAMIAIFLLLFPYRQVFETSRASLVANFISIIYLIVTLFKIWKVRPQLKLVVVLALITAIVLGIMSIRNKSNINSLLKISSVVSMYRESKDFIQKRESTFKFKPIEHIQLYHPEKTPAQEVNVPVATDHESAGHDQLSGAATTVQQEIVTVISNNELAGQAQVQAGESAAISTEIVAMTDEQSKVDAMPHANTLMPIENILTEQAGKLIENEKSVTVKVNQKAKLRSQPLTSQGSQTVWLSSEDAALYRAKEALKKRIEKEFDVKIDTDKDNIQKHGIAEPAETQAKLRRLMIDKLGLRIDSKQDPLVQLASELITRLHIKSQSLEEQALKLLFGWRTEGAALGNVLFRILIWEDAIRGALQEKKVLGMPFGKPFRSRNIEILSWASGEWLRDGWIAMHNSYFEFIYRAGVVGIFVVCLILSAFCYLSRSFLALKSAKGLLLTASLAYWLFTSCVGVVLELPFYAIPFWTLFGLSFGYLRSLRASSRRTVSAPS